jgi:hypothetical protein
MSNCSQYHAYCLCLEMSSLVGPGKEGVKNNLAGCQWLISIILATWEAEIRRIKV